MDLRGYINALSRSWLIICLLIVAGVGIALAGYRLTPATYASTVTFYVASPLAEGANPQAAGQFAESRVTSYALLLQSDRLAEEVAADAGVPAESVYKAITATAEVSTVLVTATISSSSEESAQLIAAGVADVFPSMVDELDNEHSSQTMVNVSVVSGPTTAIQATPSLKKFLALGLAGGLLLGAVVALLRELLDVTVRNVDTATSLVKAPVLGTIDHDSATKKRPLIVGAASTSVRAESFRQLRANLRYVDTEKPTDVLLVTSSLPVEGKSTVASDLALSFEETGCRVLLIDADLRRPSVAGLFGLEQSIGLTNVLVDQVSIDEAIQTWGDSTLDVLTSGSLPPNPSELLGASKMAQVMSEVRERYDKVIIDAPPLLPVADAVVASELADGVLFVVRYGRTTRATVANAARALHTVDARIVGTVLNMRRMNRREHKQYAGSGYAPTAPSLPDLAVERPIAAGEDATAGRRSQAPAKTRHPQAVPGNAAATR